MSPGREVVLLLVAGTVGDVRLAVDAEHRAVGVDHRQRVEVASPGALEERDRHHDAELGGEVREACDRRVPGERASQRRSARRVWSRQKYGVSNSSCSSTTLAPLPGGVTHEFDGSADVGGAVGLRRPLRSGNRDAPHAPNPTASLSCDLVELGEAFLDRGERCSMGAAFGRGMGAGVELGGSRGHLGGDGEHLVRRDDLIKETCSNG